MKTNTNIILIVVVTLGIGGALYWFFTSNGDQPSLTVADITTPNAAQTQFQTLLSELPMSFDTTLFSDPRFTILTDLTVAVVPEPVGRSDPFAPISSAGQ